MICSVRPIIIAAYNLTREMLQNVFNLLGFSITLDNNNWISQLYNLGASKLKEVIKYFCGDNCIAAAAYKFLDATGKVIGYVDGQKCTWLKQADQYITGAAKAVINLLYGTNDPVTVTLQNSETKTFTAEDLGDTLTNIIANPFTCIDIIYKTGVNVFERVVNTSTFNTTQTTSSQSTLGNYVNTAVSITGTLLNQCENLYNTYVNDFKEGSVPDSGISGATSTSNTTNVDNVLNQAAMTTTQLIDSAINVLTNSSSGGSASSSGTSITDVAASTITTIASAFRGLFGGLC